MSGLDISMSATGKVIPVQASADAFWIIFFSVLAVGGLVLLIRQIRRNENMKINKVNLKLASIIGVIALAMVFTFAVSPPVTRDSNLRVDAWACGKAYNSITGAVTDLGCKHNLLTTVGMNDLKSLLGGQTKNLNETTVAIGNNTAAQVVGDTALQGEWSSCGLTRATGTYYSYGNGQWNVSYTFTSTCSGAQYINATGIYNDTATGHLFAEVTYGSTATLNNVGDQFNATWGFQVSG